MLSALVGSVDINGALVLMTLIVSLCIVITSLIIKRRSRTDVANEFELAKMRQTAENDRAQFSLETDRAYKFKQLDSNLITSHHREN